MLLHIKIIFKLKSIQKLFIFFLVLFSLISSINSQNYLPPLDTTIFTDHNILINGQKINYVVETGMQPVFAPSGMIVGSVHYTYYKRKDIKEDKNRPVMFSFNGGPGSGSVWMELGYTGPKLVKVDQEGFPMQPYGYKDNPYSLIDQTDIVFINPIKTGYSYSEPNYEKEKIDFFGYQDDLKYLARWINMFISRHDRWLSPKFLIGESYGGTRVMGLSNELQSELGIYLNGVILVSPADFGIIRKENEIENSLNLGYLAATAWHFKKLRPQYTNMDLEDFLVEVEDFAKTKYLSALIQGSYIDSIEKNIIASKVSDYIGIDKKVILQNALTISNSFFWKELLRDSDGKSLGRLDSRYLGLDKYVEGSQSDYYPELSSWMNSFTPAINHYIQNELKFKPQSPYILLKGMPWNHTASDKARDGLRLAMAANPYLNVLCQSGYYDGATTYTMAKYTLSHLDPLGRFKSRLKHKVYKAGHMMYLKESELIKATQDLREFIKESLVPTKVANN